MDRECLRKQSYQGGAAPGEGGRRGTGTEGGVPGRGVWPQGVGFPRVFGAREPGVCPASLESPGDFLTEDPGGVRCVRSSEAQPTRAPLAPPPRTLFPNHTLMRSRVIYISWLNFVHRWIVPLISPKAIFILSWASGWERRGITVASCPLSSWVPLLWLRYSPTRVPSRYL